MDLAVLIKLFTALKDWLRIHVVLGHISDCKLISHQKRAAKHHKHVSCLPDSDQRKKMETHSDTPTIMMKTVTKFWFFKKKETVFHSICIKNVCLFLLCVFQKHAFFSCFFSYSCTTSSFPVLSLPFLLFCFCLVLLFSKFFIGLQFSRSCTFSNYLLTLFYNPLWLSIFICVFPLHIYS